MTPANRERYEFAMVLGQAAQPITTWAEVAAYVDEPTWQRILGDLAPASHAEAIAARPPRRHLSLVPDPEETP